MMSGQRKEKKEMEDDDDDGVERDGDWWGGMVGIVLVQ